MSNIIFNVFSEKNNEINIENPNNIQTNYDFRENNLYNANIQEKYEKKSRYFIRWDIL